MTDAPSDPDAVRQELYRVMKGDQPFEAKAEAALRLGADYLGVENGHVARIDPVTEYWEAVASSDDADAPVVEGDVFALSTTYCRRTIEADSPVVLHDVTAQGWADDPAFETHGLHCYHGIPLTVDGELYGTVCFVSTAPRERPFDEGERTFAELIAQLLEHELERRRQRETLARREALVGVLSRVLRHNLRNHMAVVRGRVRLLTERHPSLSGVGDFIVGKINDLLVLSDTARDLESVANQEFEPAPVDLASVVRREVDGVRHAYPTADVAVTGPDSLPVSLAPTFGTAVEELVENAVKHGEDPTVEVRLDETDSAVTVTVADDGPGLPAQERAVLRAGSESPLVHGSGLGLWLTYWIVTDHDGTVDVEAGADGTTVTLTVPKGRGPTAHDPTAELRETLRVDRDRFRAVFEGASDAMVVTDDEWHYVEANQRAAALFGLPARELLGRTPAEFFPELSFDATPAAWLDGRDEGTAALVDADGQRHLVEYTAEADVVPGQHLAIFRDVTDREERERALEATTGQLEAVVAASPDPIIALDEDGVVRLWNEAAADVFGHDTEAAVGSSIRDLELHTADQAPVFEERFQRALDGERFTGLVVRRQRADGSRVRVSLNTAPIRDEAGDVIGVVAVGRDVTAIEPARRERSLLAAPPDLCFVIDEQGVYRDVLSGPGDDELVYGDPAEFLGRPLDEVLPADIAERIEEGVRRALRTDSVERVTYELDVDAGTRTFVARAVPLERSVGGERAVALHVRDVTEPGRGVPDAGTA